MISLSFDLYKQDACFSWHIKHCLKLRLNNFKRTAVPLLPLLLCLILFASHNLISAQSLRGLSVLNDSQVWVSGNKGYIGKLNADTLLECQLPTEYHSKDFRDIHGFNAQSAIAMSVADSGVLLKTWNGGKDWFEVYRDNDSGVFFDVIEFHPSGKLGILMGDPLPSNSNYIYFRLTLDSGNHWIEMQNSQWNKTSPKLNSLFAASGSSIRIIDFKFDESQGLIHLKCIIGGGGPSGASLRLARVTWNIYGELVSEKTVNLPLPLPESEGWGVYGMSQLVNDEVLVAGGHWKYPNGQLKSPDSANIQKQDCDQGLFLLKFSDASMSLRPLGLCNYVSGTTFLPENRIVSVGTSGVSKMKLPRTRRDPISNLSWDVNLLGITEYVTNFINTHSTPFKGLNAVSVSENYVWIIGTATKPLLLRIPQSVY